MVAAAPTLVYDHAATHEINVDPDWRRRWAGVTVPALVCSGDQSFPGMIEAADAVAAALPSATRRMVPGQGHRPAPDAIVPVLVGFLRS
jgi:pimeloyl-ACP methyl ester carboxylesterase